MNKYAVVTLQASDEVMVVSSNWLTLDQTQCYWPPFRSPEKYMEAVRNRLKPETGGKQWKKINVSFHREYDNFDEAKKVQKRIKEQRERSCPGLERNQEISKKLPLSPVKSTSNHGIDEILRRLTVIERKVKENSDLLQKILQEITASKATGISTSPKKMNDETNPRLPLNTFEDVARIEGQLGTAISRKKYAKYLSVLGGSGPKDAVKKIMQNLLTDDLANMYNWQGRGDKRAFSQLMLANVIRDAAFKRNVNRVDCENAIKKYLNCTAGRIRARKRKRSEGDPVSVICLTTTDNEEDMDDG